MNKNIVNLHFKTYYSVTLRKSTWVRRIAELLHKFVLQFLENDFPDEINNCILAFYFFKVVLSFNGFHMSILYLGFYNCIQLFV